MSMERRIAELEEAAMRQGLDAFNRRLAARLRGRSEAELSALQTALEAFCRTGEAAPGLIETLGELTRE